MFAGEVIKLVSKILIFGDVFQDQKLEQPLFLISVQILWLIFIFFDFCLYLIPLWMWGKFIKKKNWAKESKTKR